ncbi:hypothetical protein [Paenibacillus illinoisensis]|uniref:hypothetical protein n=1 Tax=Paenibacillus illinoisensis TaxID=59845 RepID=UPI003CF60549
MSKQMKSMLIFMAGILPTVISIQIMIHYFPATGLGRIITIPFTYIMNSIILMVAIFVTRLIGAKRKFAWVLKRSIWVIVITLHIAIVIYMHPQENGDTPWRLIMNSLS